MQRSAFRCLNCDADVLNDDTAHVVIVPALDDPREAFFMYSCAKCWPKLQKRLDNIAIAPAEVHWSCRDAS